MCMQFLLLVAYLWYRDSVTSVYFLFENQSIRFRLCNLAHKESKTDCFNRL